MNNNLYESQNEPQITITWPLEDNLIPIYSNTFAVLIGDDDAVFLFGSAIPTGAFFLSEDEKTTYFNNAIQAQPLVKIVMNRKSLSLFYQMLKERVELLQQEENK